MAGKRNQPKAGSTKKIAHFNIVIKGIVQGVGFRPFVYNLAKSLNLKGNVLNSAKGVIINVEGPLDVVECFIKTLQNNPPRLAVINSIEVKQLELYGYQSFEILYSKTEKGREALVPPDIALCEDCKADVLNPKSRHFYYPFTNCTNCGPRFTIVKDIPYDRKSTSMSKFPMCKECKSEYENPKNRRFHAQPVACPKCGPNIEIRNNNGNLIADFWLEKFKKLIKEGKIGAIKGLGGFHLVCDAKNEKAIRTLRYRKKRPAKPFAVMCRDLKTVKRFCFVNEKEAKLLTSPEAPIVILERKATYLPKNLAPGLNTLGVMLPYTPLHLLFFDNEFDILVMTSGNVSELPIIKDNQEAFTELGKIADFFIIHNRDIVNRCDDSVTTLLTGEINFIRRSRGYVPRAIKIPAYTNEPSVLGIGADMKNTFCLIKNKQAYLSQYIGELNSLESEKNLLSSLNRFRKLIEVKPKIIAFDLHPDYNSSKIAKQLSAEKYIPVQHHHAHFASCLAENNINQPAIGVIMDGTGYGTDGCIWGFEILSGNYLSFKRHYHLKYIPLPGGETAVKNPWMMGISYLQSYLKSEGYEIAHKIFINFKKEVNICWKMLDKKFNSPLTSSCGRLFDAVSSLLGICYENSYEGQAAVEISEIIPLKPKSNNISTYSFSLTEDEINPGQMLREILHDINNKVSKEKIAIKFHNTISLMVLHTVKLVAKKTGYKNVVLSGGVWQNVYLFNLTYQLLIRNGFSVIYHKKVPCNDGGISLGQAIIARRRCEENVFGNTR